MGRKKKEVNDGKQTLKQAKAAFKARGSTLITDTEKRQLERGAVLLQRAERIKEQEARRKEVLKKKSIQDAKSTKTCLLGTQRVNDRFGHQRSQFHLGAFLKPKCPVPSHAQKEDLPEPEPWEADSVDDDTLLDLAGESPLTTIKGPPTQASCQQTPTKISGSVKHLSPSTTDEFGSWDGFLDRSSQIARDLLTDQKPTPPVDRSFDRIPSFTSADFDLSVDDLEELDWAVETLDTQRQPSVTTYPQRHDNHGDQETTFTKEQPDNKNDMARKLMPPPPTIPVKRPPFDDSARPTLSSPPHIAHGISIAELEILAGEEIQLSQFADFK